MTNGIKTTDKTLPEFGLNFATVANANLAALGLTAGDMTALSGLRTPYTTGLDSVETAKQAAKQAVTAKDTSKGAYVAKLRELANKVLGNPTVSPALIAQLGLNPHHTKGTRTAPKVPTNLVVTPFATGVNELKWKPNTNITGTTYVIEHSFDGVSWSIAGATTTLKFSHTGQTPGLAQWYRVSAQRRNLQSVPSTTASVYVPGVELSLVESKAA